MLDILKLIWVCDVFNFVIMEDFLFKKVFKVIKNIVQIGVVLDFVIVDVVVVVMKDWVMLKGVKFFFYIFYFMINVIVEKYDGFIIINVDGVVIIEFIGSLLIKGELDGFFFLNGSLCMINVVCGYIVWDLISLVYIMEIDNGVILMIFSVFMFWIGEVLDKKIFLLCLNCVMNEVA